MSTKLAICADLHIWNHKRPSGQQTVAGVNLRAQHCLDVLRQAVETAQQKGATYFLILGDLFDGIRPEPQLVAAVQKVLLAFPGPRFLLVGNHDQGSLSPGDHTLGSLALLQGVQVIDTPRVLDLTTGKGPFELVLVPYRPESVEEWLPKVLEELSPMFSKTISQRLMLLHCGIWDSATPKVLQGNHDSIATSSLVRLSEQFKIPTVFAGHWHPYRRWWLGKTFACQVGTLCPPSFRDAGLEGYGRLVIYDVFTGTCDAVEVPGPRFVRVRSLDGLPVSEQKLHVIWEVEPEDMDDAMLVMSSKLADGDFVSGEVVPIDVEQARVPDIKETSEASLKDEVVRFVERLALSGTIPSAEIVDTAMGYLKGR